MKLVPFNSYEDRAALVGRRIEVLCDYGAVFGGIYRERLGNWIRIEGREYPKGRLWILIRTIAEVWAVEVEDVKPKYPPRHGVRKRPYEMSSNLYEWNVKRSHSGKASPSGKRMGRPAGQRNYL